MHLSHNKRLLPSFLPSLLTSFLPYLLTYLLTRINATHRGTWVVLPIVTCNKK